MRPRQPQISSVNNHEANFHFPLPTPAITPALDPLFRPAALASRAFQQHAHDTGHPVHARFALEQADGAVSHFAADLVPTGEPGAGDNFRMLERLVKTALWARGGFRIHLDAPADLVERLRAHFRDTSTGRFDSEIVGERVYGHPIEVVATKNLPAERSTTAGLGGHLEGCRIGFDLGGSDRKVAALVDGRVVWSEETEWDPYHQPDPQYHWNGIMDSLRRAAEHLPRVDAIGGSAAGVYVDNQVKFSSLFRGVEPELFERRVKNIFRDLKHEWNDVPFDVVNDGEVTALLGSMSMHVEGGVLGIALGTSTAGGYVTAGGHITPWLGEIAFVPVDYRLGAPRDEWSGDLGCAVQYLSQQAVARLLGPARIEVPRVDVTAGAAPARAGAHGRGRSPRRRHLPDRGRLPRLRDRAPVERLRLPLRPGARARHLGLGRRRHDRRRARRAARRLPGPRVARRAAHARREGEAPRAGHGRREPSGARRIVRRSPVAAGPTE